MYRRSGRVNYLHGRTSPGTAADVQGSPSILLNAKVLKVLRRDGDMAFVMRLKTLRLHGRARGRKHEAEDRTFHRNHLYGIFYGSGMEGTDSGREVSRQELRSFVGNRRALDAMLVKGPVS